MLISVIMGVYYQKEDTSDLRRSVLSILKQTHTQLEFLICASGSCTAALELLSQFACQDSRIHLIEDDGDHSLSSKLNLCLRHAQGQWIARQDDDDVSAPCRLEKQLAYLVSHPEYAFVGSNVFTFCKDEITGQRCFPSVPAVQDFFMTMPFIHPALLFRRSAFDTAGWYSQSPWVQLCEDYELLLRMYAHSLCGCNLQTPLFYYQVRPDDYKKRLYRHRINEAVTRFNCFRQLHLLPKALPYVAKPLLVGLLPPSLLEACKRHRQDSRNRKK